MPVYTVTYPYDLSGSVEGWIRRSGDIIDLSYGEQVTCEFASAQKNVPETIRDISKGQCEAVKIREEVSEIDV